MLKVFPVRFHKSVPLEFMIHHLIMCHKNREAVRRNITALHIIPDDLMGRCVKNPVVPQARSV